MSVILLGGGNHCKQVIDIFTEQEIEIVGIYDDNKTGSWYGYPILGTIKDLNFTKIRCNKLFCCIGDNEVRRDLMNRFSDYKWTNCISEFARISKSAKMGTGNYIGAFSQVLADSILGDGNIINEGAIVTHDITIGNFNHIAPGSVICGNCEIGNLNLIGAKSVIIPKLKIGDLNLFGAGAVINKGVDSGGTYVGVPIKLIEYK